MSGYAQWRFAEMKADCAGAGRRGSRLSEVHMPERPCGTTQRAQPPRASRPRNIGKYVFTATRKKLSNRDFR